ncbi:hypothetical protein ACTABV_03350 [Pseudomonas fragariae (ex Marin et al. 2024)]|uniref:hypothetical protein n=1 Tax=Pseudomonas fragariae (ex Marin et al. 2024) TaxID=3080056 RepID=UPI003F82CC0D
MDVDLKKAIKVFLKSGSVEKIENSDAIKTLKDHNILVPSEIIEHDALISMLGAEKKLAKKKDVVDSFLVGLENGAPEKRAALSAFAIMLNFPSHHFKSAHGFQCDICGAFESRKINFTLYNVMRYVDGSTNNGDPGQLYVFLKAHNLNPVERPKSIGVLKAILNTIRSSDPSDTPTILEKKIRALPDAKLDKEQSRGLLDLLGHIGVLESAEHKGFINEFKNLELVPTKSRSSDWSYPVDFWKGECGINEDAVEFWFGEYLKLFN